MGEDKSYKMWLDSEFYEIDGRYAKKLGEMTLPRLIEEYEAQLTYTKEDDDYTYQNIKNWDYYQAIRREILNRLQITETSFLKRLMVEIEESLKEQIKELTEKFTNHRHNVEKTYGEKPVW